VDFTPSPAGAHIAYLAASDSEDADDSSAAQLWLDGAKLADLPGSDAVALSWDASGSHIIVTDSRNPAARTTLHFPINPQGALARR
jgi:hypothetical protein